MIPAFRSREAILAAALFALPYLAPGEVADSSANGFTVKLTVALQAGPDDVYRKLLQIGNWWDSAHTYSGDAHNLTIEEKAMGCFCEKLADNGAVRHMEVVFLMPGKMLVMTGGLGPLQSMASTGSMTMQLAKVEGGTRLQFTYAVAGYAAGGMNALASPVEAVLSQQLARLKAYIELGDPALKPEGSKSK